MAEAALVVLMEDRLEPLEPWTALAVAEAEAGCGSMLAVTQSRLGCS